MTSVFVTQDKVALYYQPNGANTAAVKADLLVGGVFSGVER